MVQRSGDGRQASTDEARERNLRRIRETVARIPAGCVASYAQVAWNAGLPGRARLVGRVLSDFSAGLPWHRVLNAQGRIAIPAHSPAHAQQREYLLAEGIVFIGGRVDFKRQGWRPTNEAPVLDG